MPLGDLTGYMSMCSKLGSPREKAILIGQGQGLDERWGSLLSIRIPASDTDLSVRQRTLGGGGGFQDWQEPSHPFFQ